MNKIKCPHCGKEFNLEESDYDAIAKQIHTVEFEKELHIRLQQQEDLAAANQETARAKMEAEKAAMQAKIDQAEAKEKAALDALNAKKDGEIAAKNLEIAKLQADIRISQESTKNEVTQALEKQRDKLQEQELSIAQLKSELQLTKESDANKMKDLLVKHQEELKSRDDQIAYWKEFKAKLSTKNIGESLEQYCFNQFNAIRMAAYPNAYFEKDNQVSGSGSKGDFIFREKTEEGAELLSIMFEMKNEADTTSTKHKNEDFFKELDKDRVEKGCEYAVLVSMLEADSDYYNAGIVQVYQYPKMFVVRPQCFLAIISILKNAALNAADYKNQLMIAQRQSVDVTNFENELDNFKTYISTRYEYASDRFQDAIKEIDKSITALNKVRDALLKSEDHLRLANDRTQNLTIKALTANAPSIAAKFNAIDNNDTKK